MILGMTGSFTITKPEFEIFDYDIYTVCGDGCLMEGVGSEAASLAAHLGLDNLCWIYDITIEGTTRITFTEDVEARFLAYEWNVLRVATPMTSNVSSMRSRCFGTRKNGLRSSVRSPAGSVDRGIVTDELT